MNSSKSRNPPTSFALKNGCSYAIQISLIVNLIVRLTPLMPVACQPWRHPLSQWHQTWLKAIRGSMPADKVAPLSQWWQTNKEKNRINEMSRLRYKFIVFFFLNPWNWSKTSRKGATISHFFRWQLRKFYVAHDDNVFKTHAKLKSEICHKRNGWIFLVGR